MNKQVGIFLIILASAIHLTCTSSEKPSSPPSEEPLPTASADSSLGAEDRDKFLGTWQGKYGCGGLAARESGGKVVLEVGTDEQAKSIPIPKMDDQFVVEKGEGDLEVLITIHANTLNPDTVVGTLTDKNVITVPEQSMGGFPGTAKITYVAGGTLDYSQENAAMSCGGTGYTKAPGTP